MEAAFRRNWGETWKALGCAAPEIEPLLSRYRESHRHYHNVEHIVACLEELGRYGADAGTRLALFLHDAICEPTCGDNEVQSAALAREFLKGRLEEATVADVCRLIMATDHKKAPTRLDEQVVVDVDLSILGQAMDVFDRYEAAIRKEYAHVAEGAFRAGRAGVLQRFLARKRIYQTAFFFEQYEQTARVNLERSLKRLKE